MFHDLPLCRLVQVHVSAAPEVIRKRLLERDTHRHPVHYDADAADEIAERARGGEWDPLPIDGELIRVDTSAGFPDACELALTLAVDQPRAGRLERGEATMPDAQAEARRPTRQ